MGFDDQDATKKEKPKMVYNVMIVLLDEDEPYLTGGIEATGRDDAIAKALLKFRIEENRVNRERCKVRNVKTGEIF